MCPASQMDYKRDLIIIYITFYDLAVGEAHTLHSASGSEIRDEFAFFFSLLEVKGQPVLSAALRLQMWTCFNQSCSVPNKAARYVG